MNRDIKFRAWDGEKIIPYEDMLLYDSHSETPTSFVMSLRGKPYNYKYMQFTGLKDKNGKDIYESDIVALDMWQGNEHGYIPEDGIIKWHQTSSAFKWFSLEEDKSDANNYWLSEADEKQREIVGNIYENPELLEKAS